MNILHITPYYTPAYAFGGVVRSVEGMARAQAAVGHHIAVLTTDALTPGERFTGNLEETIDGVHITRVYNRLPRGTLNLSTPSGLVSVAHDLIANANIIHCHEFRTVENLLLTNMAKKMNKPLVLSPHGTLTYAAGRSFVKAAWDALISPRIARRFDTVIGLTQVEADEARQLWGRFGAQQTDFAVIPNGVNPAEFENLSGVAFREQYNLGNSTVVLFLGRLHPRKGAPLLAEAFQAANAPDARLVIAGPDEGALTLIQPHLDERVILTGFLDNQARLAALAAADLFVLPAIGEGFSMAALEAMAAGLPVIISRDCHLPEVSEMGAGLEVERTVDDLAAALRNLLTDAIKRRRMGVAARHLAHQRFTWERVAAQLIDLYRRSIAPSQTTP